MDGHPPLRPPAEASNPAGKRAQPAFVRSVLAGMGGYLPPRVMDNAELSRLLDTSDEWIVERTGIRERRIAAPGETASDLAVHACLTAIADAGSEMGEVDGIVLATSTPDRTYPATATYLQAKLGIRRGFAFDVSAVCAGFVHALAVADAMIRTGQGRSVLVVGTEVNSRILDWTDRNTAVLFGDGAGAVLLRAGAGDGSVEDRGILATRLHADGSHAELLHVDGGPGATGTVGHVRMQGREVFRHAVTKLSAVVDEILADTGLEPGQVDWLVPHQANLRIIEGIARKLSLPAGRVVITVDRHANTSAASIPLALAEAKADGRLLPGQVVLMEAIGGGLTWGAALARL